jgi:hypothetical protein
MIKILLKLLGNRVYQIDPIDIQKLQDWLYMSFADDGFKHYYTMRKKYLMSLLGLGLEGKEQWETLGRLKELQGLATNINSEFNKRKKLTKKEAKKSS